MLLLDDVFTTGARLQSAASALEVAGATVLAAVVAARIINPDFGTSGSFWEKHGKMAFRFDRCCL